MKHSYWVAQFPDGRLGPVLAVTRVEAEMLPDVDRVLAGPYDSEDEALDESVSIIRNSAAPKPADTRSLQDQIASEVTSIQNFIGTLQYELDGIKRIAAIITAIYEVSHCADQEACRQSLRAFRSMFQQAKADLAKLVVASPETKSNG